ncbi:nucleotidyltransferase family protein [Roseomonas sp. CCTCC AB2023176]|uniref:nucleotidyltransferase family protein n=1 Tax=Roseomonas sp. CCTCC AB2023176 TaxID=3342640 RepID=UPI0035E0E783
MDGYPTYEEIRARRLAALRAEAIAAARAAAEAGARHGVRVVVFGSVATGRMHERSDLDLALDGPKEAQRAADTDVWLAAADHGFESDVVLMAYASASLLATIRRDGRDPADLV